MVVKIIIAIWLYVSVGFGMLLLDQLYSSKHPENEFSTKLDPDDEDFGGLAISGILCWPILLIAFIVHLSIEGLRTIFRKLWDVLDKKEDSDARRSD